MRARVVLSALLIAPLLGACTFGSPPAQTATAPATSTGTAAPATSASSTIPSTPPAITSKPPAIPSVPQKAVDPHAAEHIPDVGQMPTGFTLPRTKYVIHGFEALKLCVTNPWYPALAQREASRFRSTVSETFESGGGDGVVILTTTAAAEQLMTEVRAAAQACLQSNPSHAAKSLSVPLAGPWQDAFGLAYELRKNGKPITEAYGTAYYVARKGRVVVATSDWTMYAQPVSGEEFDSNEALTRLSTMLASAKA